MFGAFCAGRRLGHRVTAKVGAGTLRKVPNNTYYQGSQEFSASVVAYRPGSLTDAQEPAVACPPRTPLCLLSVSLLHICLASRFHSI